MDMFLKLVAVLLCVAYATCEDVQSTTCEGVTTYSRDVRMEVSGCGSEDERCPLIRGTSHRVVFTFVPTLDFKNKTDSKVYGVFEAFSVPYGKRGDACAKASTTDDESSCTSLGGFIKDREFKHTSEFAVSSNYPLIKLKVRFVFYDRRSKLNLLCQEVAVEIKEASTDENEA